ncbi:hypothetical protein ACOMHN_015770 [Nucella lapillus]
MDTGNSYVRRSSRQMSQTTPEVIRLEDRDVRPARLEGTCDVFRAPMFTLVKSPWVSDADVNSCRACNAKFSQLRRKHHCRQCGLIFCNKCCKEKVPLPQLSCEEPERVCEQCRPVAELVTKSRSTSLPFQLESAKGLAQATKNSAQIHKVVELGGVQALITLALIDSVHMRRHVTSGLHELSSYQQLHCMLAEAGAIKAVCKVLTNVGDTEDCTLCDGISALMVFCKAPELKTRALDDGALGPVLTVCSHPNPAPALLALQTLALIAESAATHSTIVDSPKQALPRILSTTTSQDEQMQELSLKILAHLSNGNDHIRHRIIQEDFSSGRSLQKALGSTPKRSQILCNAACLMANLATSPTDQGGLQEVMELMGTLLQSNPPGTEFLCHLTRALANFAAFKQNANRLEQYVSVVVRTCLRSGIAPVRTHALRFLLSLLSHLPDQTAATITRDGAQEVLQGLGSTPGLMEAARASLITQAAESSKPL